MAKYHSAVLPGAWKICEGILGCAQLSTKPRKDDQDPWVEDIGRMRGLDAVYFGTVNWS